MLYHPTGRCTGAASPCVLPIKTTGRVVVKNTNRQIAPHPLAFSWEGNHVVLGKRLSEGSYLTVGIAAELFMFIFFWLLTAYYVKRANGEFDAITTEIIRDASKEVK